MSNVAQYMTQTRAVGVCVREQTINHILNRPLIAEHCRPELCSQATDKLPTVADLSSCQLEYLPENIFVNEQLAVLNLQHNTLREKPIDDDIYVIGWLEDLTRLAFSPMMCIQCQLLGTVFSDSASSLDHLEIYFLGICVVIVCILN